jgi:hypothetical protein
LKTDRGLKVPLFRRSLLYPEPVSPSLFTTNVVTVYARYELGGDFERYIDGMRIIKLIYGNLTLSANFDAVIPRVFFA